MSIYYMFHLYVSTHGRLHIFYVLCYYSVYNFNCDLYFQATKPSPIALEPVSGHKAAVISLLVRLPVGDEDYTPSGQSGFVIGSAFVTLGKVSICLLFYLKSVGQTKK